MLCLFKEFGLKCRANLIVLHRLYLFSKELCTFQIGVFSKLHI